MALQDTFQSLLNTVLRFSCLHHVTLKYSLNIYSKIFEETDFIQRDFEGVMQMFK